MTTTSKLLALAIAALIPVLPLSVAKLAQKHAGIVMLVSTSNRGGGTGFHVQAPSGKFYIMTNKHVCSLADKDGNIDVVIGHYSVTKKVVKRSKVTDLCLVEPVQDTGVTRFRNSNSYMPVITSGHGALNAITSSIGFKRADHTALVCTVRSFMGCAMVERYSTDAYTMLIIGGHSGSPILTLDGALVGVMFAGGSLSALAVPTSFVLDFLKDM